MPTRKQRRRAQKERRHEYETVWVDEEGNELEEPPEDAGPVATRERREDGKPQPKAQQRGGRATREPPVPSWQRSAKRSLLLGIAVFLFFYLVGEKNSSDKLLSALAIAALYVVLFVPFTYAIDRMTRKRWEQRQAGAPRQRRR
jgi:hypothetical protein